MKKILIIIENLSPPKIYNSGIKGIYNYLNELDSTYDVEILTTTQNLEDSIHWSKKEKFKYHFIKTSGRNFLGLLLNKIRLLFYSIKLGLNKKYYIYHDFGSIPAMTIFTLLKKIIFRNAKFIFTLCTVNTSKLANFKFAVGLSKIDFMTFGGKDQYNFAKNCYKKIKNKLKFTPFGYKPMKVLKNKRKTEVLNIVYVGPLEERKGFFTLVKSWNLLIKNNPYLINKVRLKIITVGKSGVDKNHVANKSKFKKMILYNNFDIVEKTVDINEIFSNSDIVVMPLDSLNGTLSQPLTLLEAMSKGNACIVSDLNEHKEIIKENISGVSFKATSPKDLAKKLFLLISNKNLRKKIGINAKNEMLIFKTNNTIKILEKLYNEL